MRLLSLRLIVSLIVGMALVSSGFAYYEVLREKRVLRTDLERRAEVLGESLVSNVEQSWNKSNESLPNKELQELVQRFGNREHLLGVVVYDQQGGVIAITPDLSGILPLHPPQVAQAINAGREESTFAKLGDEPGFILALPIRVAPNKAEVVPPPHARSRTKAKPPKVEANPADVQPQIVGALAVVNDASYIRNHILLVWRQSFLRTLAQVFFISLITLLIVRWSVSGPMARAAQWMRAMRTGKVSFRHGIPDLEMFRPLAHEVATMAESLSHARKSAENEARLREAGESSWTAERLSVQLRSRLDDGHLVVVSNREPYMHERDGKEIKVVVPPSGLVTAIEPVLTACDGTWIAHGSGSADYDVVDASDCIRVPPEDPRYSLRRVWLTKEEEEGYYYGFANEGLWPLCHIAHTRPLFRAADWQYYQEVNYKFMNAVLEEIKHVEKPVVLVQDYHFALLPRLIKEKRPDARIAIFWHIPWPNPEAFGICPWQQQLVDGLLGADLIGFHIQSHCNNFLQTVDRVLESRVDWEHFSALRQDHRTLVRPFPISVALTDDHLSDDDSQTHHGAGDTLDRSALLRNLGIEATSVSLYMGIGVDRVDYTKGILERFLAIERFLEKYPVYQGKFTFVQIGAPSRTHIKRYHDLFAEVEAEANRINRRFQGAKWKPIALLTRQHSHQEISPYYRAADLCLVTSLHDGMNLVAKEFIAARTDDQGVLILSQFTGAARELRDSLLINPYDIDQTAEAIRAALEMEPEDKQLRMSRMRKEVKEHNIYRWAGDLITELCEIRLDAPEDTHGNFRASASVAG